MSRSVKKFGRLATYLFFLAATFIVSSLLTVFQMKRSETHSNIPTLAPTVHADTPGGGACAGGGIDSESGPCNGTCAACDAAGDGDGDSG